MEERNFYNTYLTFGLTSKERDYLKETEQNASILRNEIKNLVELHWIDCEEFSDVLAIPAFMILIRFENLEEDEFEAFNECFKSSDIMIFSLDENPYEADFIYYPDFDLLNNKLDQIQLLRTMMIMEKQKHMLSSDDIIISTTESYVAVDMSFKGDEILYDAVKIKNGKVQTKERMQTKNLSQLKEWINATTVLVWQRELSHNGKSYSKIDISDKLIDVYLLSAIEHPVLSIFQKIDDRLKYFFDDCDEKNNCMKIAYLFLIVLHNLEKN